MTLRPQEKDVIELSERRAVEEADELRRVAARVARAGAHRGEVAIRGAPRNAFCCAPEIPASRPDSSGEET